VADIVGDRKSPHCWVRFAAVSSGGLTVAARWRCVPVRFADAGCRRTLGVMVSGCAVPHNALLSFNSRVTHMDAHGWNRSMEDTLSLRACQHDNSGDGDGHVLLPPCVCPCDVCDRLAVRSDVAAPPAHVVLFVAECPLKVLFGGLYTEYPHTAMRVWCELITTTLRMRWVAPELITTGCYKRKQESGHPTTYVLGV
jgi:hypothetical protein